MVRSNKCHIHTTRQVKKADDCSSLYCEKIKPKLVRGSYSWPNCQPSKFWLSDLSRDHLSFFHLSGTQNVVRLCNENLNLIHFFQPMKYEMAVYCFLIGWKKCRRLYQPMKVGRKAGRNLNGLFFMTGTSVYI